VLNLYDLLLFIAGCGLMSMACDRRQELKQRMMRAAVGAALIAYGLYLLLFYQGGPVVYSSLVLIIPVVLGIQYFRERADYKLQQEMADDKLRQEMEALTRQYAPESPFGQSNGAPSKQADS
jgi:hypothetical protein